MAQKLVLIGASTGGPGHIKKLLKDIRLNGASVVIAQHMNKMFIPSFASQVGKECGVDVELLSERKILKDKIYICDQNFIISDVLPISAKPVPEKVTTFTPNVDVLFHSGISVCKHTEVMAVLLTGIGDDGAAGLAALFKAGAKCLAESEESAIVYGMPKRAKELNPQVRVLNVMSIKKELQEFLDVL
ncbi:MULTISPECIES: CheB methylesterase domain-containing protein [unclassified Campylobacter]|uniref:CheB methylesterase domain-containing protein n=1 Tax=unclassified Campylobacter TaxID=2593542 RepID=UPI003D33A58E